MPSNPLSRRLFLKSAAATGAASLLSFGQFVPNSHAAGVSHLYTGLKSDKFLGDVKTEAKVVAAKVFTEGPAVDRAGNVFFTNTEASRILKWDGKELAVFRENSNAANGLLFEPDGSLLACEGGAHRVTRTNMQTGEITVLADMHNGFPLAAPNDVAVDAAGRIYFTSRPGVDDPAKGNVNSFYRIDPDGKLTQLLAWPKAHMPNGIVTSPDDKVLYVIEAHPAADHARNIQAYELGADGSIGNPRTHIDFYPGRSGDGMCIDAEGNLYVAAGLHKTRKTSETLDTRPGIHVISPAGRLVAFRETPEDTVTNCTFGGEDLRTLYITCGTLLLSIPTTIPGKPAYRPKG